MIEQDNLHPEAASLWEGHDLLTPVLGALNIINDAQQKFLSGSMEIDTALGVIGNGLDDVFQKMTNMDRQLLLSKMQGEIKITPSVGGGISSFKANNMLVPAATFLPSPADLIIVAHSFYDGTVFAFDEARTSKKLEPAIKRILEKNLDINIVKALFGRDQLDVTRWYTPPIFNTGVKDTVNELMSVMKSMTTETEKEITISIQASGLEGFSSKDYDAFAELIDSSAERSSKPNWKLETDFSHIGESVGWIYGGIDSMDYSSPAAFTFK